MKNRRIWAFCLVIALLISVTPLFAFAEDGVTVVTLSSDRPTDPNDPSFIFGSDNAGAPNTITDAEADAVGGVFFIGDDATGTITIDTGRPVTLVGMGLTDADVFNNLSIDATRGNTQLTLRDVYIDNRSGANTINFTGTGNILTIDGVNLIDHVIAGSPAPNAAIHVPYDADLTIVGDGTLHLFRDGFGAGIGGNQPQPNGTITFGTENSVVGPTIFAHGTRAGATIGSGSNNTAAGGTISFLSGNFNISTNAAGAAIGGGGSGGVGGEVIFGENATVSVYINFSGAAVGGGGGGGGANTSAGGTAVFNGGSVLTYARSNALGRATPWGDETAGVTDKAITAARQTSGGDDVHLLVFDTAQLQSRPSNGLFTVSTGGNVIYSGGLHTHHFVGGGVTLDNWIPRNETRLFLFMTAGNHTLSVNGETFTAGWDAVLGEFVVTAEFGTVPSTGVPGISVAMIAMLAFLAVSAVSWGFVMSRKFRRHSV